MYFLQAFRPLLVDFLSTIVFVALYAITGSIRTAIVLGIGVGVAQIAVIFWHGKRPDTMQWASLALVVALGSASLITHDPRFVMIKPSIGGFAIGFVMLKPNWQGRYLPPIVTTNAPPKLLIAWGYIWSALLFALAFANLIVAFNFGPKIWAWYTAVVPMSAQIALFVVQYATIRYVVRRNIIAARNLSPAPAE